MKKKQILALILPAALMLMFNLSCIRSYAVENAISDTVSAEGSVTAVTDSPADPATAEPVETALPEPTETVSSETASPEPTLSPSPAPTITPQSDDDTDFKTQVIQYLAVIQQFLNEFRNLAYGAVVFAVVLILYKLFNWLF